MVQAGNHTRQDNHTEQNICEMLIQRRKAGGFGRSDIGMLLGLAEDTTMPKAATIATQTLGDIGPDAKEALPVLLKLFDEYVNHHFGESLARAIASTGENTPEVEAAFRRGRRSKLKAVRAISREAIRNLS